MKLLIILFLIFSCGRQEPKRSSVDSVSSIIELETRSDFYQTQLGSHQDASGFIMSDTCDSTFFSGLLAASVPSLNISLVDARDEAGAWHRRVDHECGPAFGNSRSTISRDMMLGVMWYMWRTGDLSSAEQLMAQLQSTNYILLGDGTPGELLFIPAYTNTLAQIIQKLGGPRHEAELLLPAVLSGGEGFEAHLAVWHILLRGELLGSIPEYNFSILHDIAEANPQNPLFQAAYAKYLDGNYTNVLKLLLQVDEWPADRLPSSREHCDVWPVQRAYTEKDWGPCSPEVEHSGAELIVIYHLILQSKPGQVEHE